MRMSTKLLSPLISASLLVASSVLVYAQSERDATVPAQTKSGRVEGSSVVNRNDLSKTDDQDRDKMNLMKDRGTGGTAQPSGGDMAKTGRDLTVPAQTKPGRVEGSSITDRDDRARTPDRMPDQTGEESRKMGKMGGQEPIGNGDHGSAKSQKMGGPSSRESGRDRGRPGMGMSNEHPDD